MWITINSPKFRWDLEDLSLLEKYFHQFQAFAIFADTGVLGGAKEDAFRCTIKKKPGVYAKWRIKRLFK